MDQFGTNESQRTQSDVVDVVDQAKSTAREVQSAAIDLATTSSEALKGHASHAMEAAKDVASSAQERIQDKILQQKGVGADYVNNFAATMRRAAGQFDADVPVAGDYIRKAAAQVENAADSLRDGNFNDLVQGVQNFARSQPTAFFGLALLTGFGAVRFLKSASRTSDAGRSNQRSDGGRSYTPYEQNGSAM